MSAVATPRGAFPRLLLARVVYMLGISIQVVGLGWHVYSTHGKYIDLAWLGLAQFLPMALTALPAGQLIDRLPKARVMLVGHAASFAATSFVAAWMMHGDIPRLLPFLLAAVSGTCAAFIYPGYQSLYGEVIPKEQLARMTATIAFTAQLASVLGPAIGGLLNDRYGVPRAMVTAASLLALSPLVLFALRDVSRPMATRAQTTERGLRAIRSGLSTSFADVAEGLRFLADERVLLGAITLDLVAVLLAGAEGLFPAFAREAFHGGAREAGFLRASFAAGALLLAVVAMFAPPRKYPGRVLLGAVGAFGISLLVFSQAQTMTVALVALACAGGADMVNIVVRRTLIQVRTPAAMRGRVQATNMVFLGASNELGEFESGMAAAWLGLRRSVLCGAVLSLAVVALWSTRFRGLRDLRKYDEA